MLKKKRGRLILFMSLLLVIGIVIMIVFFRQINLVKLPESTKDSKGRMVSAKAEGEFISVIKNGQWEKIFIKGVNIGAGSPGYFPGEFGISKQEYLNWFELISNLNANTIRVYTILSPDFYEAFYEYNQKSETPLYLIHGVWINEKDILSQYNAYAPEIFDVFKEDITTVIDVIHGNKIIKRNAGHAAGIYEKDISPYVLGYILGIEWDPQFVMDTNNKNLDKINFKGNYLSAENANPFENFLAIMGDHAIEYETEAYHEQRLLSYSNWVTTDMLTHTNEPLVNEDLVSVNVEHIKRSAEFTPGLFASYHVYPYYPDLMNYQPDYINFMNTIGKPDPYEAYLKDLRKEHTIPVLVAEFGIPASRGQAHVNQHSGFNQGFVEEKAQGQMIVSMLRSIKRQGYAGGLVFSWQDEWFKRTWNTMDYDLPMRRAYWNNQQTNEQCFGLLAFDSGEKEPLCQVDGDSSDWQKIKPLASDAQSKISVMNDAAYVYLLIEKNGLNLKTDEFVIAFDTISNQGNDSDLETGTLFDHPTDFIIKIKGENDSRIMVDAYYDSLQYSYADHTKMIPMNDAYMIQNSGVFSPIYLCLSRELTLPLTKEVIPFNHYETGKLLYGNANSKATDYNSLADFYAKGNFLEIRIPWQLFNVMDPSSKVVMDDFHKKGVQPLAVDAFSVGIGQAGKSIVMKSFNWDPWEIPVVHERLKPSYEIVKKGFLEIDEVQ